ncbi:MAG: ATP-binding protein [Bacteroidales bacterium]|nr:ATP-binding protein [Bacteroidales bacterium]
MMNKRFDPIEGRNAEIIESVMNTAEVSSLPEDLQFKIRLCVEEVEENILCYSGSKWVEVTVAIVDGMLHICFKDGGIEFDPLAKPDPDINAPIEMRQVGGLGIFICKQMMDSLNYHFENDCNVFEMCKKIQ